MTPRRIYLLVAASLLAVALTACRTVSTEPSESTNSHASDTPSVAENVTEPSSFQTSASDTVADISETESEYIASAEPDTVVSEPDTTVSEPDADGTTEPLPDIGEWDPV